MVERRTSLQFINYKPTDMKYVRVLSILIFAAALLFAGCSFLKHSSSPKAGTWDVAKVKTDLQNVVDESPSQIPPIVPLSNAATLNLLQHADLASLISSTNEEDY